MHSLPYEFVGAWESAKSNPMQGALYYVVQKNGNWECRTIFKDESMKLKALIISVIVSLLSACTWWEVPNRYGVLPSVWNSLNPEQQQQIIATYNEDNHWMYDDHGNPLIPNSGARRGSSVAPKPKYVITPDGRKKWSVPK